MFRVFSRQLNHKEGQSHKKDIPEEANCHQESCHYHWAMKEDFPQRNMEDLIRDTGIYLELFQVKLQLL